MKLTIVVTRGGGECDKAESSSFLSYCVIFFTMGMVPVGVFLNNREKKKVGGCKVCVQGSHN